MTLPDRSHSCLLAKASFAAIVFALLTGCGIGTVDRSVSVSPSVFQGKVHGGENPIGYSLVSFYETANTGVATAISSVGNGIYVPGSPLTALGSTYTDINGNFNFFTPLACKNAYDYVYVTAAGGNPGNNAMNGDILLMAAVGSCSSFGASTDVTINELTTIAAAYALSSFISVSGSYTTGSTSNTGIGPVYAGGYTTFPLYSAVTGASGQLATFSGCAYSNTGVGDPTGVHSIVSSTATSITIAGQYTKYTYCGITFTTVASSPTVSVTSSATNYIGALSNGSYAPTASSLAGLAHAFANANNLVNPVTGMANTASPSNSAAVMPTSLINTLGNVLQGCVNSTGGVATVGATAGCPALFEDTIIATTTGSGTTTNTPANTLQAMVNIAHAPGQNVSKILVIPPPIGAAFAPAVTNPTDFTMAIAYPQGTGQSNGYTACYSTNLTTSNGLCVPQVLTVDYADNIFVLNTDVGIGNVVAFNSAGANLFATALNSSYYDPYFIAADNIGNVFYTYQGGILELKNASTSSSPIITTIAGNPYSFYACAIAFDSANNLYAGSAEGSLNNLYKYPFSNYGNPILIGSGPTSNALTLQIALDSSGDAWLSEQADPSTGTALVRDGASAATVSASEIVASGSGGTSNVGIAIDSRGDA
jgi:hypothetical protein